MKSYNSVKNVLKKDSFPYRLFETAKKFGVWNPADIDLSQDKEDWKTFNNDQREEITTLLALFAGGEEAVTAHILPLMMTCADKGWIEEEMYLTTFVFEEAKHIDFFRRVNENLGIDWDLSPHLNEGFHKLFGVVGENMARLKHDQSPEAIIDACVSYNMYAEAVAAESAYWYFEQVLGSVNKMPGLLEGISKLKHDESRHISFGTFMCQRQISQDPSLLERAMQKLQEYEPISEMIWKDFIKKMSFGITADDVEQFSQKQFKTRISLLEKSKNKTLEEIYNIKESELVL